jgi:outer membrane murein-binding lipoprotein Lpp
MKYIAILALVGLLLLAGCAKNGINIVAPEDTAADSSEPTELTGDMAALEEDAPAEDVEIDTAELENLDM